MGVGWGVWGGGGCSRKSHTEAHKSLGGPRMSKIKIKTGNYARFLKKIIVLIISRISMVCVSLYFYYHNIDHWRPT